ncbi:hypothetical protein U9M48_014802 [Paspalum notatum var. saurae]|uniref:Uncharacterized protein n=1 Tax=Paspalum notatum var. saurae TaxID=547442 RepID=A0AAQ3T5B7_PASNO
MASLATECFLEQSPLYVDLLLWVRLRGGERRLWIRSPLGCASSVAVDPPLLHGRVFESAASVAGRTML